MYVVSYYSLAIGLGDHEHALTNDRIDVSRPDKLSGADIAAICQEAGMQAVRKNRYVIMPKDFEKGYKANVKASTNASSWIF